MGKTSPVQYELQAKDCMPSRDGPGTKPVPLKFMINEPHRKYETDSKKFMTGEPSKKMKTSWSRRGGGMLMYPWVTPRVSQCSPDTAADFINYFEDLKLYANKKDKIGDNCYMISRRQNGDSGELCPPNKKQKHCPHKQKKAKKANGIKYGVAELLR